MLYVYLPPRCRFYSVTDSTFHLIFIKFFEIFLEHAAENYLEIMDDDRTNDGDRLIYASAAKGLHEYKIDEHISINTLDRFISKYEYENPEKRDLLKTIPLTNCQFNFWDYSSKNLILARTIWNAIKEEFGIDNDEDYELEVLMPNGDIMVG